jgi:hypothetical protein
LKSIIVFANKLASHESSTIMTEWGRDTKADLFGGAYDSFIGKVCPHMFRNFAQTAAFSSSLSHSGSWLSHFSTPSLIPVTWA